MMEPFLGTVTIRLRIEWWVRYDADLAVVIEPVVFFSIIFLVGGKTVLAIDVGISGSVTS
jgi:hypothetical protein